MTTTPDAYWRNSSKDLYYLTGSGDYRSMTGALLLTTDKMHATPLYLTETAPPITEPLGLGAVVRLTQGPAKGLVVHADLEGTNNRRCWFSVDNHSWYHWESFDVTNAEILSSGME